MDVDEDLDDGNETLHQPFTTLFSAVVVGHWTHSVCQHFSMSGAYCVYKKHYLPSDEQNAKLVVIVNMRAHFGLAQVGSWPSNSLWY